MMINTEAQPTKSTPSKSDEVQGIPISLDPSVPWAEWRLWLRPIIVQNKLRPYGLDLSQTSSILVLSLDQILPRISGMQEPDKAYLHFFLACELQKSHIICLPITLVRSVDFDLLFNHTGVDEAGPPLSASAQGMWKSTFDVVPHFCTSEFVTHYALTLSERKELRRLFERTLHPRFFDRISSSLEYRN